MKDVFIVLTGRRQHGKDTVADIAIAKFACAGKIALADYFKVELAKLFQIPLTEFYSNSGKDTALLTPIIVTQKHLDEIRHTLSKYGCLEAYSLSLGKFYGRQINSVRDLMLWYGNEIVYSLCGWDFHCKATELRLWEIPRKNDINVIIITDARFHNQSKYFLDKYPYVYPIKIIRPGGSQDEHAVEAAVDQFPKEGYFFKTIVNDGTIEQLENKVKSVMIAIKSDLKKRIEKENTIE